MKQIDNIKKKIKWEEYYNPAFDWRDWGFYSNNILSEDFIREFKDKVDWSAICRYQKLSEDFIREFKDKVHWGVVSIYQNNLSDEFKTEFANKLNFVVSNDVALVFPDDTTKNRIQLNRQIFDKQLLDNPHFLDLSFKMTNQCLELKSITQNLNKQLIEYTQLTEHLLGRIEYLEQKNIQLQEALTNLRMWGC